MAKYPKHSYDTRPIINTPKPIERLEEIDQRIRENKDRRKRQRIEARNASERASKRRHTIIGIIIAIIIIIAVAVAFTLLDNERFAHAYELPYEEVIVHQGDSIDGIAACNPVEGLSAHELGWVISEINKDNPRRSIPLQPGDRLLVPIEE